MRVRWSETRTALQMDQPDGKAEQELRVSEPDGTVHFTRTRFDRTDSNVFTFTVFGRATADAAWKNAVTLEFQRQPSLLRVFVPSWQCPLRVTERDPRALRLQFVEQAHHVVGRELEEHGRGLLVLVVGQRRVERLHCRHETLFLSVELSAGIDRPTKPFRRRVSLQRYVVRRACRRSIA